MNLLLFKPGDEISGFNGRLLVAQKADEHLAFSDGSARCSLWWTAVPSFGEEKLGVIGHFQAESAEQGSRILAEAVGNLRKQNRTLAVGPMDGNTWGRYRVLSERGSEPPFFMEPDNPDWWTNAFEQAGFSPLGTYSSSLVEDLAKRDPRAGRAHERLLKEGIHIRNLDMAQFESDLRRIYQVSVVSFTENYLYTEVSEEIFLSQYMPYKDKIRPELVYLAEHEGQPVGYLFAIPDYAELQRGQILRTVIGKTLAVLPGRRYGGLGVVLTGMLHERAMELGFKRVIHALQYEGNSVRNMSGFFGRIMRRYTLYSHKLP